MRKKLTASTLFDDWGDFTASESIIADLITFGGKAYPTDGQVLLVAGGAGSGKGTIIRSLIGLQGKIFDVDQWKEMATSNNPKVKEIVRRLLERKLGKDKMPDLDKLNLRNPDDVTFLHKIMKDAGIEDMLNKLLDPIKNLKNKPNLIYDKTLKSMNDIQKVVNRVLELGYKRENIHLVWVLNELDIAIKQNESRDRVVDERLLRETHAGVSKTMNELIHMGDTIGSLIGGDIWIAFNKARVDVTLKIIPLKNTVTDGLKNYSGTLVVDDSHCVKIKEKGKNVDLSRFEKSLSQDILQVVKKKIAEYTHDDRWLK